MSSARLISDLRTLEELGVATTATFARCLGCEPYTAAHRLKQLHKVGLVDRGRVGRQLVYAPKL